MLASISFLRRNHHIGNVSGTKNNKMSIPCSYKHCQNIYRPGNGLSFFKLPKDDNRKTVWKKHSGQPKMNDSARICDQHFFHTNFIVRPLKKTLTSNALPKTYSKSICSCDNIHLDKKCEEILSRNDVKASTSNSNQMELEIEDVSESGATNRQLVASTCTACPSSIQQINRNIQLDTFTKLIASNNPCVQLQNAPSILPANSNFKLVFVNGSQQDMALCMACKKLEFVDDGLQNHHCTSIRITNVSSLAHSTCPSNILLINRNIQRDTITKLIESKNPSVKLKNAPSILPANSNFKLVFVNGSQQDMALCTTCSKLEFIDDGLKTHQCTSIRITDVKTLALPIATDKLRIDIAPTTRPNKPHPRNMAMVREQLAFSFCEMFPLEGFNDTGFKAMTKYLLNLGATYGKVNVKDLLGDQKTLEEERKSLVYMVKVFLKKVVAEEKLVFSCDMWKDPQRLKICITMSSHYIDDNFALHRNVLGTRVFNENEFDADKLVDYATEILSEYTSTPSSILSNATIVTGKTEEFLKCFRNFGRLNCMCTILNEVVNHSLALPCFHTESVCKAIIIRLERQHPNEKYDHAMANYNLNDWFSIWYLFKAYQHYLETTPNGKNIIPDYEILYTFVMEAQKASKLLSSNNEATISTVYLIKKKLIDVMRGYNTGSFKYPEYKDKITSFAENIFEITDIHRITLFLDPRYKSLKFLSKEEKDALHQTVRGIIGEIFIPDENVKRLLNLGNHVSWVDTNGMAEVDNYLNLMNISPDTNVLEFWKLRVDFPKLRTLAKEMLCIPAVSAAWECYFNKDKFKLSRRRLHLNLNELDTTLLLNGHSYYGMFDEQLKILFDS